MSNKKINKLDITKLSVEDLKKIATDELLTYIDEHEDKNKIIIYLIKIIQQNSVHSNKIVAYRSTFIKLEDLENKLTLIHKVITDNYLGYNSILANKLRDMEKKLLSLRYTDLREINKLEKEDKKLEYQVSLDLYNRINREMRLLFADICELYTNSIQERDEQKRAREDYIEVLLRLRSTPELNTNVNIGGTFEEFMLETARRAKLLNDEDLKLREINEMKAQKFYEEQEKLKKEKGGL